MDEDFGMDDDLSSYTDDEVRRALTQATAAQSIAASQVSQAADFTLNTSQHVNLTESLRTLTQYVDRLTAEVARRGLS